jgi:hypothetical protein
MTTAGLDPKLNLEMVLEATLSQILQSPRRELARMRNCYWQAGFKVRTRCPARCSLAVIEKLGLLVANCASC